MTTTTSCLSNEEQATLKTALAFVVLRNRQNHRKRQKIVPSASACDSIVPPFCRNLLQTASVPLSSTCDKEHVDQMLKIALSAMTKATKSSVIDINANYNDNARFSSIAAHIARHLLHSDQDWLHSWFSDRTLQYETKTICSLWHCMAQSSSSTSPNDMTARLIQAVGRLIDNIYHDRVVVPVTDTNPNGDIDTLVVNLLLLLEAFLSIRLEAASPPKQLVKELLEALDHKLTLFVPVQEMPSFVQANTASRNLSPPSKIMLRLALYDLTVKLTL
ncbi:hypothetical protein MHU86_20537 [Fragilaria crotonensis]|nr:hypothetical protein MHU86_20537 [Fragilaria crotonensis]